LLLLVPENGDCGNQSCSNGVSEKNYCLQIQETRWEGKMGIIYSREGYNRPTVGHMGATDSENNLTDCMSSHLRSSQCYVTHCVRISPDRKTWSMFKPSLQNVTLHKAVYL